MYLYFTLYEKLFYSYFITCYVQTFKTCYGFFFFGALAAAWRCDALTSCRSAPPGQPNEQVLFFFHLWSCCCCCAPHQWLVVSVLLHFHHTLRSIFLLAPWAAVTYATQNRTCALWRSVRNLTQRERVHTKEINWRNQAFSSKGGIKVM